MNTFFIYRIGFILVLILLTLLSCEKNAVNFPISVEKPVVEHKDRAPVKQNQFVVTALNDEKISFQLGTVDTEKISSLLFSYTKQGLKVETELTDFKDPFVIVGLPVQQYTEVEVWAKGKNGVLSEKYIYRVFPLPYPSSIVLKEVIVTPATILKGIITVKNETAAVVKIHYKVDNSANYIVHDLAALNTAEISFDLAKGIHIIRYYLTDNLGGHTEVEQQTVRSWAPGEALPTAGWEAMVSSVETQEGPLNGQGKSLIDGNLQTFWHSTWSSSNNPVYPHWFIVDMKEVQYIHALEMIRRHNNATGGFKTYNLEYSLDNVNWVVIQNNITFNSWTTPAEWQTFEFDAVEARYIRVTMTQPYRETATNTHLAEVRVREASLN